jgi:hypothetical protein
MCRRIEYGDRQHSKGLACCIPSVPPLSLTPRPTSSASGAGSALDNISSRVAYGCCLRACCIRSTSCPSSTMRARRSSVMCLGVGARSSANRASSWWSSSSRGDGRICLTKRLHKSSPRLYHDPTLLKDEAPRMHDHNTAGTDGRKTVHVTQVLRTATHHYHHRHHISHSSLFYHFCISRSLYYLLCPLRSFHFFYILPARPLYLFAVPACLQTYSCSWFSPVCCLLLGPAFLEAC